MIIAINDQHHPKWAHALQATLNLPLCSHLAQPADMVLDWLNPDKDNATLHLALLPPDSGAVSVDFLAGKKAHRRQFGGGKGQPLARAMGNLATGLPNIIDATAGMGGDSFVLASLGFNVHMIERSPIVAALLNDALTRAKQQLTNAGQTTHHIPTSDLDGLCAILNRLSLTNIDATDYLNSLKNDLINDSHTTQNRVDVVYLDPMYPEKKKVAATKKDMKALQTLVGPDLDSEQLLSAALRIAQYRVVVKRPKNAPALKCDWPISPLKTTNILPTAHISSPNTRYDIYSIKALKLNHS
ncbi:class I SAM-dependent methyltransferase [Thiomicrorhabdus aquaedulcis]|uniref:class I SAM-dependent methyltransferase n=1 Tax=Thiomicrorhabdus aquaedulcis TaxID=2211106 RepID=UPI000FDB2CD9|nr:class I SAM-dependent methyltransferase [Thiomicrorhabdus aquaedulcis]